MRVRKLLRCVSFLCLILMVMTSSQSSADDVMESDKRDEWQLNEAVYGISPIMGATFVASLAQNLIRMAQESVSTSTTLAPTAVVDYAVVTETEDQINEVRKEIIELEEKKTSANKIYQKVNEIISNSRQGRRRKYYHQNMQWELLQHFIKHLQKTGKRRTFTHSCSEFTSLCQDALSSLETGDPKVEEIVGAVVEPCSDEEKDAIQSVSEEAENIVEDVTIQIEDKNEILQNLEDVLQALYVSTTTTSATSTTTAATTTPTTAATVMTGTTTPVATTAITLTTVTTLSTATTVTTLSTATMATTPATVTTATILTINTANTMASTVETTTTISTSTTATTTTATASTTNAVTTSLTTLTTSPTEIATSIQTVTAGENSILFVAFL